MDEKQLNARYLRALRAHWIYIPVAVALAVLAALAYSQIAEPRYEASADVLVSPVTSDTLLGLPVLRENVFGRSVVTAARLTKSPQVAARVRQSLNLDLTLAEVDDLVSVTPQEQSDVVTVTGESASPAEAAAIANAFAQGLLAERTERFQRQLQDTINRLTRRLSVIGDSRTSAEATTLSSRLVDYRSLAGGRDPTLEIVSPAVPPTEAAWPRTGLSVAVPAMIGLIVGLGIALSLEIANPLVTRAESLAEPDGPPILARMRIPTDDEARTALSDPERVPSGLRAPARALWANLRVLLPNRPEARTYLVTSGGSANGASEGAAGVAALLAAVMARAGLSVTLIDADLEQAPLEAIVDGDGASARNGAARMPEVASTISAPEGPMAPHAPTVMHARSEYGHAAQTLPPDRLSVLVDDVKRRGDVLVISAPPLPAAETAVLLDQADAVVVAVAVGLTRRDRLAQLREELVRRRAGPVGFVVLERPSLRARLAHAGDRVAARVR